MQSASSSSHFTDSSRFSSARSPIFLPVPSPRFSSPYWSFHLSPPFRSSSSSLGFSSFNKCRDAPRIHAHTGHIIFSRLGYQCVLSCYFSQHRFDNSRSIFGVKSGKFPFLIKSCKCHYRIEEKPLLCGIFGLT